MRTINRHWTGIGCKITRQLGEFTWHTLYKCKTTLISLQSCLTLTTYITRATTRTIPVAWEVQIVTWVSCVFGFPQQGLGVFRGSFANPHRMANRFRWTLTLQRTGDDILIQVVHVVRHDEVLRRSSAAHEGGIEVEGWGQRWETWVIDNGKTCEDLYLLPAMESFPQSSCHFAKGLSVKDEETVGEGEVSKAVSYYQHYKNI